MPQVQQIPRRDSFLNAPGHPQIPPTSHYNYSTYSALYMPDGTGLAGGSSPGMTFNIQSYFNDEIGTFSNQGILYLDCSCYRGYTIGGAGAVGTVALTFTPIQHNYPQGPLAAACRISSWYDAIRGVQRRPHHALDVRNSSGDTPYGTPVYAMEAGHVENIVTGLPAAGVPVAQCMGMGYQGNRVNIRTTDGYLTTYYHITPAVSRGADVSQGQLIGYMDTSGCQNAAHVHVGRFGPDGLPVNFTIPCTNGSVPTTKLWEDTFVDDDDPDTP
jgi:murein DD-endopeptidase MepM/ murein hydrolase activator NlpD